MKKTVCFYQSKYGSTKQYMDWIQEDIQCDVYETKNMEKVDLKQYDYVLFAGSLFAGRVAGVSTLKKMYPKIADKKVILFVVGASTYDEHMQEEIKSQNLKDLSTSIPMFYARGALYIKGMNMKDRTMCRMIRKMMSKKEPAEIEPWMEPLLTASEDGENWMSKDQLLPCLSMLRS